MNNPAPLIHRHRQECMATFFEVRLVHEDAAYAGQAAQALFQISARLEKLLNRYRDDSEITQIRMLLPGQSLRLNVETFQCLQLAAQMEQLTGGAFNSGLGAEMDVWRNAPSADAPLPLEKRGRLLMDPESFTVCVTDGPVALDLGAIGKGYALDRMAEELQVWEISRALLVAGESSILALDAPAPDSAGWEIALTDTKKISLRRNAIGTSGTSVKGAHILDPRTGRSAQVPFRAWAVHPSAAMADALSTAWMLLDPGEIEQVVRKLPGSEAYLQAEEGKPDLLSFGPIPAAAPGDQSPN